MAGRGATAPQATPLNPPLLTSVLVDWLAITFMKNNAFTCQCVNSEKAMGY